MILPLKIRYRPRIVNRLPGTELSVEPAIARPDFPTPDSNSRRRSIFSLLQSFGLQVTIEELDGMMNPQSHTQALPCCLVSPVQRRFDNSQLAGGAPATIEFCLERSKDTTVLIDLGHSLLLISMKVI